MASISNVHPEKQDLEAPCSPTRAQHLLLQFNAVSYTVNKDCGDEKTILSDISCTLQSGRVTALMGPSGAGKTTFLNMLLQNVAHHQEGSVMANGHPIGEGFSKICNYVPQDDTMSSTFTPREALGYLARLRMPKATPKEHHDKIESVLALLGLDECADTRCGSVDEKGLSGGQKKRLSIAMELLDDPAVLVLDEPTSGLDSKAAEDVVAILQKLARESGRLVLCTIHQPSWNTLEQFDELLLLAKGKMIYSGKTKEMPEYLKRHGVPNPANCNPADHMMRVIQEESPKGHWAQLWAEQQQSPHMPVAQTAEVPWENKDYAVTQWQQFQILLARNGADYLKDKQQFLQVLGSKVMMGLLLGICWINASRPAESGKDGASVFTVTGALFMMLNNCLFDDLLATVVAFPPQKAILQREFKNGVYGLKAWFVAFWVTRLLSQLLFSLLLIIPVYFLVGLRLDDGGIHLFVAAACLLTCSVTGTTLGLAIGSLTSTMDGAMGFMMPTLVPLLLFNGYMIPYSQIPIFFKPLYWISPFQYSFNILRINQFRELHFADDSCLNGQHLTDGALYCNGNEYLENTGLTGDLTEHMQRSFLILAALGFVVLGLAYLAVRSKTYSKTG